MARDGGQRLIAPKEAASEWLLGTAGQLTYNGLYHVAE